eukprot:766904-Hanusia_phi.AAC.2
MSVTALKNACRKLGFDSWPKERSQLLSSREASDVREWFAAEKTEGTETRQEQGKTSKETEVEAEISKDVGERERGQAAKHVARSDREDFARGFVKVEKGWRSKVLLREARKHEQYYWFWCPGEGTRELMQEGLHHVEGK